MRLCMGEGTSRPSGRAWLRLRPGLRRGRSPRVAGATVLVVSGRSVQRGKESDFSKCLKLSVFCGSSYDSLPDSPFLLFPVSLRPFSLSSLEELIRRQLWLLSIVATLFSASSLGVFPSFRVERSRDYWAQSRRSF